MISLSLSASLSTIRARNNGLHWGSLSALQGGIACRFWGIAIGGFSIGFWSMSR